MKTAVMQQTLQTLYDAVWHLRMTRCFRDAAACEVAVAILEQAARDVMGARSTQ